MVLILFGAILLLCLAFHISILYALLAGLVLFSAYAKRRGFSWPELFKTILEGIRTVRKILITLLLVGMLTALWRACGTIPFIVNGAASVMHPSVFPVMTFLVNCGVSFLTGTAFGTAATMGTICAAMAGALGIDPVLTGGAVLSGVYFGDRCSPVSTCALLIADLTGTSLYHNIKRMFQSALVPFLAAAGVYLLTGLGTASSRDLPDLQSVLQSGFVLKWPALIPAAVILVFALLKVNTPLTMLAGIVSALPAASFLQGMPLSSLPRLLVFGYQPPDPALAAMLGGGGILSMLRVAAIIFLSACFSGIFHKTDILDSARRFIRRLSRVTTKFTATAVTAVITAMVSCNQTLAVILTEEVCTEIFPDHDDLARDLSDSAAVIAPLIPWTVACAMPLDTVGAPDTAVLFAFYLYFIPVWRIILSIRWKRQIRARSLS